MADGTVTLILIVVGFVVFGWMTAKAIGLRWHPFAIGGVNSRGTARRRLVRDLKHAKDSVFIVTGTGRDEFWGHRKVVEALRKAANRGVTITFLIGPKFRQAINHQDPTKRNASIRRLAQEGSINLRLLDDPACAGLRLVDNNGTYTTSHESVDRNRRRDRRPYLWTWGEEEVARNQCQLIRKYLESSSPAKANDLEITGAVA